MPGLQIFLVVAHQNGMRAMGSNQFLFVSDFAADIHQKRLRAACQHTCYPFGKARFVGALVA